MALVAVAIGCLGSAPVVRAWPAAVVTAQSQAGPRIVVDPERRDLGVVGLGEEAAAEFLVRNEGGASLTLAFPDLPRGTSVEGLVPALGPGESARLRISIDTLKAIADPRPAFGLVTNDPERPSVTLVIQLDVQPFLLVRPGRARYITVQKAREGTITQTIGAADGATFRVLGVDSPVPALRVSFREARPDEREPRWTGSQWRVDATLSADAPVGALRGAIVVRTDHPRQRRAFVPVSGFVRPILAVTPHEARLGDLKATRTEPVRLFVKNFAEELIEITGVSTSVVAVRAEIEPIEPGRTWSLKLFPAPGAPLGTFEGTVQLRTANPQLPTFGVPLSGRIVGE